MHDTMHLASANRHNVIAEYIILYDGYNVAANFYNAVRYQVEEIVAALYPDEIYTLEALCGPTFWDSLTDGQKRMAGRCMVHMVVSGLLPLHIVEGRHEYPKLYSLF